MNNDTYTFTLLEDLAATVVFKIAMKKDEEAILEYLDKQDPAKLKVEDVVRKYLLQSPYSKTLKTLEQDIINSISKATKEKAWTA